MGKKTKRIQGRAGIAKKIQKRGVGGGGQVKEPTENVFETVWSKKKFDILGKKQKKGEKRLVGQSRSLALDKRKSTLLQEYKRQGKGNVYLDRRFGERNEDLGEEEKALLRFQKERQAQINKKSKFTLADDDGEPDETLTHGGMALSNLHNSDDRGTVLDDDESVDPADEDALESLNFGGGVPVRSDGDNSPERQKSRKEVMEDVIAKSKLFKAQKARQKEEDEKLMEKLDGDFSNLVKSGTSLSLRPTRKDRLKNLLSGTQSKDQDLHQGEDEDKPDDFDKLIKDMTFDTRGQASERLKTAEEKLKEERERLEALEKKRKKRMLGDDGDSNSDEESSGSGGDTKDRRQRKRKKLEISGDDLGENFLLDDEDEQGEGGGWVDEVLARKDDDMGDGAESGDEVSSSDGEDVDEGSEDDGDGGDSVSQKEFDIVDDDDGFEFKDEESRKKVGHLVTKDVLTIKAADLAEKPLLKQTLAKQDSGKARKADQLPFVINAPETLAEFRALTDNRNAKELTVAIQRIRTCNAISLAAENRKKMQVFYSVLLQYFAWLATQKPFPLLKVNTITKPLIELSSETPYFAAHCARQWLVKMHDQLAEKLRSPDGISAWPTLRSVLQLRLWSMVFPPSDFRHPVLTPAVLLTAGYLMRCKVTSAQDVLVGSFLCSLLFSMLQEARRFCPEALMFTLSILVSALPADAKRRALSLCPAFMVELAASNPWMQLTGADMKSEESLDLKFFTLMSLEENSPTFSTDTFRCGILQSLLLTLKAYVGLYRDLACFPEAMFSLLQVLQMMNREMRFLPKKTQSLCCEVANSIEKIRQDCESTRQPLRMRLKKPTAIKLLNPKFEENFQPGLDFDPDRERAQKKKLERQIKKEARGAARELRKDNYFLLEEKAREKAEVAAEQKEKYGKAMQFLQMQESAFKSGQLGKGKGRNRRK